MTEDLPETYEYQERVAIRQFEAGMDELQALNYALIDIRERQQPSRTATATEEIEPKPTPERPAEVEQSLRRLRRRRDVIGRQMRSCQDPARKAELFVRWRAISEKILLVVKGACHE